MSTVTVPDVLEKAADILEVAEEARWGQRAQANYGEGRPIKVCMNGACAMAATYLVHGAASPSLHPYEHNGAGDLYQRAYEVMSAYLGTASHVWNDKPERTKEEVIEALRASAKNMRNWAKPEDLT